MTGPIINNFWDLNHASRNYFVKCAIVKYIFSRPQVKLADYYYNQSRNIVIVGFFFFFFFFFFYLEMVRCKI